MFDLVQDVGLMSDHLHSAFELRVADSAEYVEGSDLVVFC